MSAVRMLVLGVVRDLGQAHGYQVRRELMSWRADAWANVAPASIYQALRTLTKRGLVSEVGTESGGGPERTVYRLTPDGETEFWHLVRSAVSDPHDTLDELSAAFGFLHLLPRAEVATLLDYRVRALWAQLVRVDPPVEPGADRPVVGPDAAKPAQVGALMQLAASRLRAEIDWSLDLAGRIRDGTFVLDGGVTSKA
ncbi:PadR family transcriptional regulator [Pseudonocardia humida]|uniref:PadR family transcriptional regulator n=1 Tax=Pseudonocardia humida TaxID=2800819 RepID=A0ABT1A7I4_9PSEU|nr:PadR family transcriptional regulator [Pseudonocardia humida]MCO1658975.1 PadR family transcriptional regulator [Pseudonocardia humida]